MTYRPQRDRCPFPPHSSVHALNVKRTDSRLSSNPFDCRIAVCFPSKSFIYRFYAFRWGGGHVSFPRSLPKCPDRAPRLRTALCSLPVFFPFSNLQIPLLQDLLPIDFQALSFQQRTNPSFYNPFLISSIQNARVSPFGFS